VIVLSLAYGAGLIIVAIISLYDINRLLLTKLLYQGEAPVEFFWSPDSRTKLAQWNQKYKLTSIKRKIEPFVESGNVGQLLNILQTGNIQEKAAAADALGTIGDKRAVEPLIAALQHNSLDMSLYSVAPKIPLRVAAAKALGQLGDTRAVEQLIAALQNKGVAPTVSIFMMPVQAAAAAALGQLGDSQAIEPLTTAVQHKPLTSALQQNYEEVRIAAVAALEQLGRISPASSVELTYEERQVLTLLVEGSSNVKIAEKLSLSPVHTSLLTSELLKKFGAKDQDELVKQVKEKGLLL